VDGAIADGAAGIDAFFLLALDIIVPWLLAHDAKEVRRCSFKLPFEVQEMDVQRQPFILISSKKMLVLNLP